MADISKIKLPSGDTYDLKDNAAVHKSGDETIAGSKNFTGTVTAGAIIAPSATTSAAGLMSASDKEKLDMITPLRFYNGVLQYFLNGEWIAVPLDGQPLAIGGDSGYPAGEGVSF